MSFFRQKWLERLMDIAHNMFDAIKKALFSAFSLTQATAHFIWLLANSQFASAQNASIYLARALR
jgi:hypothetical protein